MRQFIHIFIEGLRRLLAACGCVCREPYGFSFVNQILLAREKSESRQWEGLDCSPSLIPEVLQLLQESGGWPNAAFHPNDELAVLIRCSPNDFAGNELLLLIKRRWGIDYSEPQSSGIIEDGLTVGRFVSHCVRAIKEMQSG